MCIMHFVEINDSLDNQVVEVIGISRHDCIMTYLKRSAWDCRDYNGIELLNNRKLLVDYDEEICILQAITEQVITVRWIWKSDIIE